MAGVVTLRTRDGSKQRVSAEPYLAADRPRDTRSYVLCRRARVSRLLSVTFARRASEQQGSDIRPGPPVDAAQRLRPAAESVDYRYPPSRR
jgi:hypothetical protein